VEGVVTYRALNYVHQICVLYFPRDRLVFCSESLPRSFMAMAVQRLLAWPKQTTLEARNLVLGLIKSHNAPISTRDLFEKAVKVPASPAAKGEPLTPWARHLRNLKPSPPHPEHPIRSLKCVLVHTAFLVPIYDLRSQLPETNGLGGARSHAGHQKGTYKTGAVPRGNRAAQGDDVQGATQEDLGRVPRATAVDVDVAAGGQTKAFVERRGQGQ